MWLAMRGRGTGCFLCLSCLCPWPSGSVLNFLLLSLPLSADSPYFHPPLHPVPTSSLYFVIILCAVSDCPWLLVGRGRDRTPHPVRSPACVAVTQTGMGTSTSQTVLLGGHMWLHKCQGGSQNPELGAVQRRRERGWGRV